MNRLILIRGIPGSGKSTKGRSIELSHSDHIVLEAYMYMYDNKGKYIFNPNKLKEAHKWCQTTTRCLLLSGKSVIVCNTFIKLWELDPYIKIAKEIGCDIEILRVVGNYVNTHNVPQDTIDRMKSTYEYHPDEIVV